MKRKNSNKRKFKFSKYKIIRNFTIIGLVLFLFFTLKSNAYNTEENYKTIIVSKGQTLWNIAENEKSVNEYYKEKDIRVIINNIEKTNNLKSSTIYENQKLKIIEF